MQYTNGRNGKCAVVCVFPVFTQRTAGVSAALRGW